jgi:acyl transferase domain-containing protein
LTLCRDSILAVIKGTAINQDGKKKRIGTPHGDSQVSVIRDALHAAQTSPHQVSYVEAHGSATVLGDAIEIESIIEV